MRGDTSSIDPNSRAQVEKNYQLAQDRVALISDRRYQRGSLSRPLAVDCLLLSLSTSQLSATDKAHCQFVYLLSDRKESVVEIKFSPFARFRLVRHDESFATPSL